jgi:L-ascorbate metabolism protein UlaG (beta-lactamase superfamily)
MRGQVVHIFHNCFVLHAGERTLLFDCPAPQHLPRRAAQALAPELAGRRVTAFVSHSHTDHCHPDLAQVCAGAAVARFVFSDDVAELYPQSVPPGALVLEPDQEAELEGVHIETLASNDLGLAFVLELEGLRVYHGGDLAAWVWDTASPAEKAFTAGFFSAALERIARKPVDIGFTNVDRRLANLAGGPEFARVVRPRLLVPMHAFGRTAWLADAAPALAAGGSSVFLYRRPGDRTDLPDVTTTKDQA